MVWKNGVPACGDMIRVKAADLYHYGIFSSADEVYQFGLAPNLRASTPEAEVEVCVGTLAEFAPFELLEVAVLDEDEKTRRRTPEESVSTARARLGARGYSMLFNNCEHFAYECVFGVHYSSQAEELRRRFMTISTLDVYIAKIPESDNFSPLFPPERDAEVAATSNKKVRKEKYYVWRLLEHALGRSFGYKMENMRFSKEKDGRWIADRCCFSLSHSDGVVAVAVSRKDVGIDIQRCVKPNNPRALAERILTENEMLAYTTAPDDDFLVNAWSLKEAIYKRDGVGAFVPSAISSDNGEAFTSFTTIDNVAYVLSVVGEDIDKIRIFEDVSL